MRTGQAASPPRKPGSLLWLHGLVCGGVVTLATPTALLAGVLLAPGVCAVVFDRTPGRPMARCVLLWGVAVTLQPMLTLWRTGHSMTEALGLATDTPTFAWAWAAQAAGWLLSELMPLAIRLALDSRGAARAMLLRKARTRYQTEWNIPPPE